MKRAFVLLSGGLDSTTCLHKAIIDYAPSFARSGDPYRILDKGDVDWVEAVSIDYGQRHKKEMEYARRTCARFGIFHTRLSLGELLRSDSTMLTESDIPIPSVSYSDLPHGVSPTYVPFRNGMMLSALAAHAQKWINEENQREVNVGGIAMDAKDDPSTKPSAGIYFGAHAEDAQNWAYPDCTPEFIGAMANAIHVGTYYQVRLHTPLMSMLKSEIVTLGDKLGVRFEDTWSCYKGDEYHCGVCPTCRSRREAFIAAGVQDPTEYGDLVKADEYILASTDDDI